MKTSARPALLAGLLACLATPALGQVAQDKPAPAKPPRDDIVVSGQLGEEAPTSPLPGSVGMLSRAAASDAHRFVRCLNGVSPKLQRSIVEGHARHPATRDALDLLIQSNTACYPRFFRPMLHMTAGYFGACNPVLAGLRAGQTNNETVPGRPPAASTSGFSAPQADMALCRSTYDRGAIVEEAFRTYAPHFLLTRADTLSKEVIGRFWAREELRGKLRGPTDRRYYETVACMVQLEPESAVRLLRSAPGTKQETGLRLRILSATRYCTGNAKKVSVDAFQFRGYIADAIYHWTVAAKNVETLIPAS